MKNNHHPLRILVLEDVPADVTLINYQLQRAGLAFETTRVETRKDFLDELTQRPPDVILSDHGLPSFDGNSALALACEKAPDTPFIFVTGSTSDEIAMDEPRIGAPDYVLKTRLTSLVPAIRRAMRLADERALRRRTERALRASAERFDLLACGVRDQAIALLDADGNITSWNHGAEKLTGWSANEVVGWPLSRCYPLEEREQGVPGCDLRAAARDGRLETEGWRSRRGPGKFWAQVALTACRDDSGHVIGFTQVTVDLITRAHTAECRPAPETLLDAFAESLGDAALYLLDGKGQVAVWAQTAQRLDGYSAHEVVGSPHSIFATPDDAAQRKPEQLLRRATTEGRAESEGWRLRADGTRYRARTTLKSLPPSAGTPEGFIVFVRELAPLPGDEANRMGVQKNPPAAPAAHNGNGTRATPTLASIVNAANATKSSGIAHHANGDASRWISPLQRVREATEATEAAQRSLETIIAQTRTPWGASALLGATQVAEVEKTMRTLRARLAERELALAEAESKLACQERDLAETEALLVAREQLVAAMSATAAAGPEAAVSSISPEEIAAFKQLKQELARQEQSLKEAKTALRDREQFVEQSEAALLQKIQAQQERELELEQRAEDLQDQRVRSPAPVVEPVELLDAVLGAAV